MSFGYRWEGNRTEQTFWSDGPARSNRAGPFQFAWPLLGSVVDDVREGRVVFDGRASVFAVVGWVLMGAAIYSRRRQPPSEPEWSMPVDRG
ncbi:hypothetical protein EEB12_29675 [Rhodococcus sp. WS1]|nr:hypothetical protein EEB12_29675 [Rhodococcus sp. WS1]